MTPKYNPQKEVQRNPIYYHPTPESWFADVDYPNPARQKQEPAPRQKRHRPPKRKAVIRIAKMQGWDRLLLFILAAIVILKLLQHL